VVPDPRYIPGKMKGLSGSGIVIVYVPPDRRPCLDWEDGAADRIANTLMEDGVLFVTEKVTVPVAVLIVRESGSSNVLTVP
jgi:hypothetical protein